MQLPPELEELLPTEEDVLFYEEHGYYIAPKVLPDDIIDMAVRGAYRHWAGDRDWEIPIEQAAYADWKPEDGEGIRNSECVALQTREIREFILYPIIGAIASRLTRDPVTRLWADALLMKPGATEEQQGPVVGWHTDRAYWMTCTSDKMLTAWVPFQDTPEEMGPVIYIDGSHKWADTEAEFRTFKEQSFREREQQFPGADGQSLRRVIPLKKGQLSFHNCRVVHGSEPNRTPTPRLAMAVHMQDGANRYRVYNNDQGIPWHIANDDLARKGPDGLPDYTDPGPFPVMWSDEDEQ